MTVLMISYDLNGKEPSSAYEDVKKMIETHSISAIRGLRSMWFVQTSDGVDAWDQRMSGTCDASDSWFVNVLVTPYDGWLDGAVVEWLRTHT